MEETLIALILTAIGCSFAVTGIVEVFKRNTRIDGLAVIVLALVIGVLLLGSVAYLFSYPMGVSLLIGVLSGFASVGAFEGITHIRK